MEHRSMADLRARLARLDDEPPPRERLELIVARPAVGQRKVLDTATLSVEDGLVGDGWLERGSRHTADGRAERDRQLTLISSRALALLTDDRARWPLAGDQLVIDLDLSEVAMPVGTRVAIGPEAELEVSAAPHTGCAKFAERFGADAVRLVNTPEGRARRLRGMNARVVVGGEIRVGDRVEPRGRSTARQA